MDSPVRPPNFDGVKIQWMRNASVLFPIFLFLHSLSLSLSLSSMFEVETWLFESVCLNDLNSLHSSSLKLSSNLNTVKVGFVLRFGVRWKLVIYLLSSSFFFLFLLFSFWLLRCSAYVSPLLSTCRRFEHSGSTMTLESGLDSSGMLQPVAFRISDCSIAVHKNWLKRRRQVLSETKRSMANRWFHFWTTRHSLTGLSSRTALPRNSHGKAVIYFVSLSDFSFRMSSLDSDRYQQFL